MTRSISASDGNATILEVRERATLDEETIIAALAKNLASVYGPGTVRISIQENVFTAHK